MHDTHTSYSLKYRFRINNYQSKRQFDTHQLALLAAERSRAYLERKTDVVIFIEALVVDAEFGAIKAVTPSTHSAGLLIRKLASDAQE